MTDLISKLEAASGRPSELTGLIAELEKFIALRERGMAGRRVGLKHARALLAALRARESV